MSRPSVWILGGIFAIVVAICIAGAVLAIAANDTDVEVNLGDDEFEVENVERRAAAIERDGPEAFNDPTGGNRPIILQHLGTDAEEGWLALLAVAPGTSACVVNWDADDEVFRDCEGETYPPDGTGLEQFPTRVEDDTLFVDLGRGRTGDEGDDGASEDDPVITGNR